MTERDPIERLEASDGLSIEPRPEFASELRIMLDLRLRMTEGDAPSSERNEEGAKGDKAGSRQRPDRLQTLILALLALLIFLAIGLVTYLAVWVITKTDSPDPSTPMPTTTAPPPDETSADSPGPDGPLSDLETQLTEAGCRVLGSTEAQRFDCSGTDLSNILLDGASLAGSDFTGAQMPGASLAGADLTGATLNRVWLYAADLTDANLSGAEILGADLNEARLVGADLSGSVIQDTFLTEADLTDATLREASLTDVILYEGDLTNADLTSASLTRVDLTFATVRGVILRNAKLSQMQLIQLDFTGADFVGLRVAADWFLVICPDGSPQGVQETVPCGIREQEPHAGPTTARLRNPPQQRSSVSLRTRGAHAQDPDDNHCARARRRCVRWRWR